MCVYLYVANEELSRRLHWCFAVDDLLHRTGPVHRLVKVFGEELVAVFSTKHGQTPVTYTHTHGSLNRYKFNSVHLSLSLTHTRLLFLSF